MTSELQVSFNQHFLGFCAGVSERCGGDAEVMVSESMRQAFVNGVLDAMVVAAVRKSIQGYKL